ncbi:sensor histidine kinase [uncultured Amnibacterium sp.]|uniref:sensor histidine kinase n=1 Tax=uncultured Amnibacterium sp. TaxID=1631851 RepID=UPI0035CA424F
MTALGHGILRHRGRVPWLDVALAVALTAADVATTVAARAAPHPIAIAAGVAISASVALRTCAPLLMAGIASAGALLLPSVDGVLWLLAAVLIIAFSIPLHARPRAAAGAVAVLLAATIVLQARTSDLVETIVTPLLIVGGPAAIGLLVRRAREQTVRLRQVTEAIVEERGHQAQLAAEAERARISRDLHDILGHTLTTIAVQSGAAEQLVPAASAARPPIDAISSGARAGMSDVRSLLALARRAQPIAPPSQGSEPLAARRPTFTVASLRPPWWDIVIAGLLVLAAWIESPGVRPGWEAPVALIAIVVAGSIVLRTTAPLLMAGVVAVGAPVVSALSRASLPLWGFAALLVVFFSLAVRLRGRRAVLGIGLVLAGTYCIPDDQSSILGKIVAPLLIAGAPVVAGVLLGRSRERAAELRLLRARLDFERDRHTALAAEAERVRIAGDVHDVLAHTLTTIAVQAAAAQQLVAVDDPARQPVDHIVAEARTALAELRSLLDVRGLAGSAQTAPGPLVAQVADLVAVGDASLVEHGMPAPLQDGVSLTAFRVVQEALTNARKHAPGRKAIVTLDWRADVLGLTVETDGPRLRSGADLSVAPGRSVGAGRGLIGMAERVAAYAGELQAGPSGHAGGWIVRATLPYSTSESERV